MKIDRRTWLIGAAVFSAAFAGSGLWLHHSSFHYLDGDTTAFVAAFAAPPAADSAATRAELDQLLELQRTRSAAEVAAARDDRQKDVARFYPALGFEPAAKPDLPALRNLLDDVESDIGPYIRDAKSKFHRDRPYVIEPKLKPCIDHVRDDASYPSGHATYGYVMAMVLTELVPERHLVLEHRADEFAHQRAVCGVHFPSDLAAGRTGAKLLVDLLEKTPEFRADANAATNELRAALKLAPRAPKPL